MKRLSLFVLLLVATISAKAQFRIYENGNISINSEETPLSPLSLNYGGNQDYFMAYQGQKKGLYIEASNVSNGAKIYVNSSTGTQTSGLDVSAYSQSGDALIYGICGKGQGGAKRAGVIGTVSGTGTGAGIFGSCISHIAFPANLLNKPYAGVFRGDVYILGSMKVTGTIDGVLLGSSASTSTMKSSLMSNSLKESTADLLTSLDATSYTYPTSSYKSKAKVSKKESDGLDENTLSEEEPVDFMEIQKLSKRHYALDAEQLETMFPDLVYEQEDGTKVINYMELIPLLVQSIGELNERINKLSQQKDYGVQLARSASDIDEEKTVTSASLQQNTPNPFSSQTKIRFTLPDNTRNAYIYIFDMNGKMQKQIAIDSSMDSVTINGYELSAGIYLYSLVVNGQEIDTKRMILSK